ncbi:hypothetical protein ACDY96_36955 [Rhizobium mongolense]|uniref:hypothetical protein n=1 Tax=Rhizobium mongolense TaxID=57676 RepID=UPI0035577014
MMVPVIHRHPPRFCPIIVGGNADCKVLARHLPTNFNLNIDDVAVYYLIGAAPIGRLRTPPYEIPGAARQAFEKCRSSGSGGSGNTYGLHLEWIFCLGLSFSLIVVGSTVIKPIALDLAASKNEDLLRRKIELHQISFLILSLTVHRPVLIRGSRRCSQREVHRSH